MNIIQLTDEISVDAARYAAAFGPSPTVVIVPPFVLIELWEHQAFTGYIAGLRVIESSNVTKPIVAHVDTHTLGKLARSDA
jgi:hypothetical protein